MPDGIVGPVAATDASGGPPAHRARRLLRSTMTPLFDRTVFRRLARRLPLATQRSLKKLALGDRATETDLAYCYRLILGRPPDPDGWRHYGSLVARGELSVQRLRAELLASAEYRQRDLARGGAEVTLAAVGPVELYVPSDDAAIGSRMQRRSAYQPT